MIVTKGLGSSLLITQGYGRMGPYIKIKRMVLSLVSMFTRRIKLESGF